MTETAKQLIAQARDLSELAQLLKVEAAEMLTQATGLLDRAETLLIEQEASHKDRY